MKRCIIHFIFLLLIIINACKEDDRTSKLRENTTDAHDTKNDSSAIQLALDNMMRDLHSHKITGNPDYDFSMLMIKHHRGAINISSAYLTYTKDEEIKKIANDIIGKSRTEINELNNWHNVYKDTIETIAGDNYRGRINYNMAEMMKHAELIRNSDPDMDYVLAILPHCQDAIEMAKVEIDFGKDDKLKNMAMNLIKVNQESIRIMEEWRANKE
jgi:uncharacterized protein (DUF305 family)